MIRLVSWTSQHPIDHTRLEVGFAITLVAAAACTVMLRVERCGSKQPGWRILVRARNFTKSTGRDWVTVKMSVVPTRLVAMRREYDAEEHMFSYTHERSRARAGRSSSLPRTCR